MDFKALQTFHRIVNTGSFHRAAKEMNYAQSTVTMQIQKLEAEIGVQLFDRSQKSVPLTEAGRLFSEQSVEIVKRMDQLRATMSDVNSGEAGSVRLGVTEPSASRRLPDLLGQFFSTYPKVSVSVQIANTPILCDSLQMGEIDLALCSSPEIGSEFSFEPLFDEEFVVLLPERHYLTGQSTISPANFNGQRLLITAKNCPYRKKLDVIVQGWDVSLSTLEINSIMALTSYVQHGLGIALVPRIMVDDALPGTAVRQMGEDSIYMTTGILYHVDRLPMRPALRELYQFLKHGLTSSAQH